MWCFHWCKLIFYEFTRWISIHSLCGHVLTCHRNFNDKVKHLIGTTKVKLLWEAWAYKDILQPYCTITCMEDSHERNISKVKRMLMEKDDDISKRNIKVYDKGWWHGKKDKTVWTLIHREGRLPVLLNCMWSYISCVSCKEWKLITITTR